MRRLLIVGLPPALCLAAALTAADPFPGKPDRAAAEIAEWIRQLGHPSFDVRQAATERLMERPDAAPALRKAVKSPDPEVARRAEVILGELARRGDKQALARLEDFGKDGEIDQAVELLVRRPSWADEDAAWQVMTGLAQRLIDLGEKEFGKPAIPSPQNHLPAGDYRRYVEKSHPKMQTTGRVLCRDLRQTRVVVRAEEIEAGDSGGDVFISAGAVRGSAERVIGDCWLSRCVVFAGGPVEVYNANRSVIVCAGDFTARHGVGGCLIVARGDVRVCDTLVGCRIIASGKVYPPTGLNESRDNQIKENEANPLNFVKWFDPANVGVVVEKAEGGVKVKEAAEGKPFAKAGLKVGDLVVAAEGKPVGSVEDFRRLLRKHLATEEELALEVRRDGQPVKVVVPLEKGQP